MEYREALDIVTSFIITPKYKEATETLSKLVDKIENGTLIEFPCKVGDTIYEAIKGLSVQEYKVDSISFTLPYKRGVMDCKRIKDNAHWKFWLEDINKTWFLTKEQAEAKLKELSKEKSLEQVKKHKKMNDPAADDWLMEVNDPYY